MQEMFVLMVTIVTMWLRFGKDHGHGEQKPILNAVWKREMNSDLLSYSLMSRPIHPPQPPHSVVTL